MNDCKVCLCIYFIKNEEEENQLKTRTHTHIQYPHTYYKDDTHYGQIYWIEESKGERRPVATEKAGGANRDRQRDRERERALEITQIILLSVGGRRKTPPAQLPTPTTTKTELSILRAVVKPTRAKHSVVSGGEIEKAHYKSTTTHSQINREKSDRKYLVVAKCA